MRSRECCSRGYLILFSNILQFITYIYTGKAGTTRNAQFFSQPWALCPRFLVLYVLIDDWLACGGGMRRSRASLTHKSVDPRRVSLVGFKSLPVVALRCRWRKKKLHPASRSYQSATLVGVRCTFLCENHLHHQLKMVENVTRQAESLLPRISTTQSL